MRISFSVIVWLVLVAPISAELVIRELATGSTLMRAGLERGDHLRSWRDAGGASGKLDSVFDWQWLAVEQAPRGPLRLDGERGGEPFSITVSQGWWQAELDPVLPVELLDAYREGLARLAAGDPVAAADRWRRAAEQAPRGLRIWLLYRAGSVLLEAGRTEDGVATLRAALEPEPAARARLAVLRRLATALRSSGELDEAEQILHRATGLWRSESPGGLGEAESWSQLAELAETRGDLNAVDRWLDKAAARLDALAPGSVDRAKIWAARGRQANSRGLYDEAEAAHRRAAELLQDLAPGSARMAVGWMNLGTVPAMRGDLESAERYHRRAWQLFERLEPDSLNAAACLHNLGAFAMQRGDAAAAEDYLSRALAIRQRVAAGSVQVANNLGSLGVIARARGHLDRAAAYYRRSLATLRQQAPGSLQVATVLTNLGNLSSQQGDLAEAEDFYQKALALHDELAPDAVGTGLLAMNLGSLARQRGDFATAESWYRRAEHIMRRSAPEGEKMAELEANLGTLLLERWDLDAAQEHLERALHLAQQRAPQSLEVAGRWNLLGALARRRGDLETAAAHQERALAIQQVAAPDGLQQAHSLVNLGRLALERQQPEAARGHARRALQLLETRAPRGAAAAAALQVLGEAALESGDAAAAESHLKRALDVLEGQGFARYRRVECLEALAREARRRGQLELAWQYLERALESLDEQVGRLGGGRDADGSFRARYGHVYRAAIEVLLELGRASLAFEVLEQRRARGLLAMLAERDLALAEIPPELLKARRRLAVLHDRTVDELMRAEAGSADSASLHRDLERWRRQRRQLQGRIRAEVPRVSELEEQRPASLEEIRASLDAGTLLLSYSVGEHESRLFALGRDQPLRIFELPIGEDRLRRAVQGFGRLIEQRRSPDSPSFRALLTAAHELYEALLGPVTQLVESSTRLLVVPDGPLFRLPFAALVDGRASGPWRYLVERRPVHVVASGTLYAQLERGGERSRKASRQLVAFGDPVYGEPSRDPQEAEPTLRSLTRLVDLRRLPASRREAEQIAGLFAPASDLWLGPSATERRAKALDRNTRYVHFAAHGLLDERFPLDSAIVLTLQEAESAGENGLLQVWEIFEQVRVDADLVVLSACQTASGSYVDGEGLIGLARAFHYAGASSVVASLWNVEDVATAELMFVFYRALEQGSSKDAALRTAQLSLLRGAQHSAPYFWAPFQLYGDR